MRITIEHLQIRLPSAEMQPAARTVVQALWKELERGTGSSDGAREQPKDHSDDRS
jgi:hypothetical protein